MSGTHHLTHDDDGNDDADEGCSQAIKMNCLGDSGAGLICLYIHLPATAKTSTAKANCIAATTPAGQLRAARLTQYWASFLLRLGLLTWPIRVKQSWWVGTGLAKRSRNSADAENGRLCANRARRPTAHFGNLLWPASKQQCSGNHEAPDGTMPKLALCSSQGQTGK